MTLTKPGRVAQSQAHEHTRTFNGRDELHTLPQPRRNGRGQGATRSVGTACFNPRVTPAFALTRREVQFIDNLVAVRMPAFDEQRYARRQQALFSAERLQLRQIGRRQCRKPHKPFKCSDGIGIRQHSATRCHHDGVEYDRT